MPSEYFNPTHSTDEIWRAQNMDVCLSDDLDTIEANITALTTSVAGKANADHSHSGYAVTDHSHTDYAAVEHTHTGFAAENHEHSGYAEANHTHDYASVDHTHTGYASSSDVAALQTLVGDTAVSSQISAAIATKVDAVEGKELSSNDFTDAEKTKLAGIAEGANNTTLSSLGITATATELNYVDGVTSNIQTQLDGKAASSHGTHVSFTTTVPKAAGTAAVGSATTVSRSDHVHPAQTTVSGNAGSATKLATARTIRTNLASTSTASFNGTANVTPGVTGTLPIANGGTGATTIADVLSTFGIEDHVVSQGKSGNTYYRKWNSGILEQWYQVSTTSQAINSAYGSLYIGTHRWTFPVAFTDVDVVLCSYFRWGTSASWGGLVGATTTYADLRGYDLYSRATGTTCTITAYAKGRWK